jgi:hypothetical protein
VEIRAYRDHDQFQDEERAAARFHEASTTQLLRGRRMIHVRKKEGSLRDLMHEKGILRQRSPASGRQRQLVRNGLQVQNNNVYYSSGATDIEQFEKAFEAMWARRNNLVIQ